MARIAPSWIRTTKVLPKSSSSKPKKRSSSNKCPVEDTGRNSVSPSTTPKSVALNRSKSIGKRSGFRRCRGTASEACKLAGPALSRKKARLGNGKDCSSSSLRSTLRRDCTSLYNRQQGTNSPSMLTLFHHPVCPHSRFVRLALGEYGVDAQSRRGARLGAPRGIHPAQPGRHDARAGRGRRSRRFRARR